MHQILVLKQPKRILLEQQGWLSPELEQQLE
jgi:hypothetical protein